MNWYKKAKIEFPTWLSQKLMEETNQYQQVMSPKYPEQKFLPKNIYLIQLWAKETNPNLESYTMESAIKDAQEWYNKTPILQILKKNNIDLDAVYYALQSSPSLIRKLKINKNSLIIKDIQKITPYIKKDAVLSYRTIIQFDAVNEYNNQKEQWEANLVTKDGKHFSFSHAKRLKK